MRIRQLVTGLMVTAGVAAGLVGQPTAASADEPTISVNCAGHVVVSANYVRHVFTNSEIGSIQLCFRESDGAFFARIEMYSTVSYGHFANAYLYYKDFSSRDRVVTCDDHPWGHVLPGGKVCYTPFVVALGWYQATGRAYRSDGSGGWTLEGIGSTELV